MCIGCPSSENNTKDLNNMGILKHVDLQPNKPLMVVVDTSVFIHKLHQSCPLEHTDPNFKSYISAQLVWLISGEWLGEYQPMLKKMVFAIDVKQDMGYWRHRWLRDIRNVIDVPDKPRATKSSKALRVAAKAALAKPYMERSDEDDTYLLEAEEKLTIGYKAGRKLPEYSFSKLKKLVYSLLKDMGQTILGDSSYEADDQIAALCVVNRDTGSPWNILDLTVDCDHGQLVGLDFTFVCMSGYNPPVRDTLEIWNEWSERRQKCTMTTWHDIVRVKGEKGDASDNLPPSAGVLIPVIDLIDPPDEHKLWLYNEAKYQACFQEETNRFNQDAAAAAVIYLRKLGCSPVVRYLPGQSPQELLEVNELEYVGAF